MKKLIYAVFAMASAVVCHAQDLSALLESSLVDYSKTFRTESLVLLAKIQNDETRRAYAKMVENAASGMTQAQGEFEAEFRSYIEASAQKDLVLRLRSTISAKEKTDRYLSEVTRSNAMLFSICSFTHSYAAPEADQQCFAILTAAGELRSLLKDQLDSLILEIERELKKRHSTA